VQWQIGDEDALASAWRAAQPFPHIVIDDFAADLDALLAMVDEENVDRYEGDLFVFEASPAEPRSDELRAVRDSFSTLLAPLSRITGKPLGRADMRAYAYRPGHYLLPHTDHQDGLARSIAYAFYLPSPEPPVGGELELFRCAMVDGEIASVDSARVIEPRANRIVLFDVGDASLHQVREVLGGLRISLAGWFYP
jgi:Rps23 Pro-64 3,4-dihydroxylase Tpa1-like proline 4-hydroxylase